MATCAPIDEDYFDSAAWRWEQVWDVPQSAGDFWADLVANPLHWCRGLRLRWTSRAPYGVGTTRHVTSMGLIRADEHFFLWEEGRRYAFHFTKANLPLFTSFGEYYEIEPTSEDTCRFTWKLAATPTALGKPGRPINNLIVGNLFRDTTSYVESL